MSIELPITKKDLDAIIEALKGPHPDLYAKLWCYKINYMNKEKND